MKERPIVMTADSVRAILEGRKTKTRRVIEPQPNWGDWPYRNDYTFIHAVSGDPRHCRLGDPGDRLWVREAWGIGDSGGRLVDPCLNFRADGAQSPLFSVKPSWWRRSQEAFGVVSSEQLLKIPAGWRNPRFMPRWASRITLELLDVQVERVRSITEEHAIAEGCPGSDDFTPQMEFAILWDCINGKRGYPWKNNPWVWVLSFREVRP